MRFLVSVLLCSTLAVAEPWDLPPPPRGQWVVDQTGKVSRSTISQLNDIAAGVDGSGAGQLGVLVLRTTSGIKPRDFATGVFNSWGVGHHGTNDGILLFVAVDDRKAEIILGDGSKVTSSQTDAVMSNQLVANMKRGSLEDALTQSASALAGHMRRAAGVAATPHENDNTGIGPDAYTIPGIDRPMLDEKLSPFAEGAARFPDRSPRSWVIDLSDALTPSQRAQLDVAASDIYASNEGRIFFLVTKTAAPYPSPSDLAKRLHRQVGPLSRLPVAVVTVDLAELRGEIVLGEDLNLNAWERTQLWKAENALREGLRKDAIGAMQDAQVFAQLALTKKIPPRGLDDVVTEGISRNA
ncbi:MAG TPA: TPM domain-containing protein, partial [Archangium sp.]